jgi:hypothetical protein
MIPTTIATTFLLATLQNDTGSDQTALTINYTLSDETTGTTTEEVPAQLVFWSLTGNANEWNPIPALDATLGTKNAVLSLGNWPAGSTLYILWADDNAGADRNNAGAEEGGYQIDDISFSPGGTFTESVTITSPTNNATFPLGASITINASAVLQGPISSVTFYVDGASIGSDTTAPYSSVYSNTTLGAHSLYAVGTDNTHSVTSATVNITVNPNNSPTVTVTNPTVQGFLVGNNITNGAVAVDSDGTIARVEFFLDGVLKYTDTTSTYKYEYDDALVGTHTVTAVAVDNVGARGSNSVTFTITNPPNVTFLLTNGSTWKYLDDTNDPRLAGAWTSLAFNDSAWSNGVAEIGFGDSAQDRPEVTQVRRVLTNTVTSTTYTNLTFYFRKVINVVDPAAFSGLVLNIKQDDGTIIYINGAEVYRSPNMPLLVDHGTNTTGTLPDDGAAYYSTNLSSSVLVAGANIIAVEMHQDAYASSDISFDLMLWGVNPSGTSLKITRTSSSTADISWPLSTPGTALLYYTDNLNPPVTWTLETAPDVPSGGFHHVTVNTTGSMRYWTLRQ